MSSVAIVPTADRQARPGDLGARLTEGKLWLPQNVTGSLARLSIRSAEDLVTYLGTFPSAVAQALGWRVEDVERAREALARELRGHLDEALLDPAAPVDHPLGAFDPALLKPEK